MKGRALTTISEGCHRSWLSEVLHVPRDPTAGGIDLADGRLGIELKCRYRRWDPRWTVHDYQRMHFRRQNPGVSLYWAFLLYGLSVDPRRLRTSKQLADAVTERECWILPWAWVGQFPLFQPKTGPYRYVPQKDIPNGSYFKKHEVTGGKLYLPRGHSQLEERLELDEVPF
jgi:hypothetical protein